MKILKSFKKLKHKKLIIFIVVIVVIVLSLKIKSSFSGPKNSLEASTKTAKVETKDIKSVLTSTGVVEPLNTYAVSTLLEGEILTADFEEGDHVEKGDVLYQITTKDLDSKIDNNETAVTRAEKAFTKSESDYDVALDNYNEASEKYENAKSKYGSPNVTSSATGIIKDFLVKEGDRIQEGSQIAEIYDNSYMLLSVPFNASEVTGKLVGQSAEVTISGSSDTLKGKVTEVSSIDESLSGNRVVNMVTIRVKNPGGLTTANTATANIGTLSCSGEGTFKELENTIITSDRSGEIASLSVKKGSKINKGGAILTLTNDSIDTQLDAYEQAYKTAQVSLDNAKYAMETAKDSIEDAKNSLEDEIENKVDYSITAPISGQIISKNKLAGDVINMNNKDSLCIIYDLSALKFKMKVDELDILNLKKGQEVKITADALQDTELKGVVTNVSLLSESASGVTQYPVTVRIDDVGNLLPGMNVDAEIVTKEVSGVLAIPSGALMSGDVVYVADPSVKEAVGAVPAGYKEVKVKTGITDGNYIEIISGLKGDEELYVDNTLLQEEMPPVEE